MKISNRVPGHALREIFCYDTVSNKTHAVCECGWKGSFRSNFRAREAHRQHKNNVECDVYIASDLRMRP